MSYCFEDAMAWGMEWEEDARENYNQFVREQRAIWTPNDLFQRCCPKWLANGREAYNPFYSNGFDFELNDGNVVGKGCDYCELAHPCIELSFDTEMNATIANLSHPLGPFVECMDQRCAQGAATKLSENKFQLDGYIRENKKKICGSGGVIGGHLVQVTKGELKKSDTAQKAGQAAASITKRAAASIKEASKFF